MPIESSLRGGE